jgi:molybdenum cofactor cytidylyltransferase
MTDTHLAAILLAAGRGTRFGEDKLVHPLADGVPIAAHAVRHLRAAGLPVTAVVRPNDAALRALLEREGCHVTECPEAASGMGHSLAHGVRHAAGAAGWVVALADMPSIGPETIARIARAIVEGASIAAPCFQGVRGHPVAFAGRHYRDLAALTGDEGARSLLQRRRAELVLLQCDDPGVLHDIDRKSDLVRRV